MEENTLKNKKLFIAVVIAVCAILIGLGCFFAIKHFSKEKIEYTVNDTLPDGNGKKATVILLGGQSNASGCSLDEYLKMNVSDEKYAEYENGYDNVYINYLSGAHMSHGFVKCSTAQGELAGGFGPELGIADKLNELYPDEEFFIIKCAWGGTNLYSQWRAPSSSGKTGELYEHFVAFVKANIEYLESKNYDVSIEAMCWMQGESDSLSIDNATEYCENLDDFVSDIRGELKEYAAPDGIAFIDAYIADNPALWVYCDEVNLEKLEFSEKSSMNALVDTISYGLVCSGEPYGNPDLAHYDSLSEIKLGHLFAEEVSAFLD